MIVFDTEGNVLRTWGDGVFKNPHGVTIAPDGRCSVWITEIVRSDNLRLPEI